MKTTISSPRHSANLMSGRNDRDSAHKASAKLPMLTTAIRKSVKLISTLTLAVSMSWLAGCATQGMVPTNIEPATRQASELDAWDLVGRIGLQMQAIHGKRVNGSAALTWSEDSDGYSIDIRAPLNAAHFEVTGNDSQAQLVYNTNRKYTAANLTELKQHIPNISLPLESFSSWVRGIPNPDYAVSNVEGSADQFYTAFEQDGWKLSFSDQLNIKGYILPTRIVASKGENRFTIKITSWDLP